MVGLIGVAVNTIGVIFGSLIGVFCKRGIPKKISDAVMVVIGICTIYIGIDGSLKGSNTLVLILSMVFGCIVGTLIDIDKYINLVGDKIQSKFSSDNSESTIALGFVTASLMFCIGSMTIVGSIEAGINGDNTMIFTKSVLDFICSIILASSLGIGVIFSAVFILLFQGSLVILASFLGQFLNQASINELVCAGSLMILALGLNMLKLTKIKIANMLPALIFVPLFVYLFSFFGL